MRWRRLQGRSESLITHNLMTSLYWIAESLPGLAPSLWMVAGVGLPWALAALSTRQWRSRALVAALALALGPAWLTAWMLALGVGGAQLDTRLLTAEWVALGSLVIAATGAVITWRKRRRNSVNPAQQRRPLAFDEKLIIALMATAVALRWVHTAFWPFTVYDALWVYGSQARLYFLEGIIPHSIDYYPQFVQLQFTYVQVIIGAINDHAARMVIPFMHIGSILAAYLLGQRLVNRRVGLITAALWSLHPYVGQWAFRGDLEIPLTFTLTMAAMFFLSAWRDDSDSKERQANAILAGIMLGIALFTKPTAGAFIWGVLLLFALELIRTRFDISRWLPRFKVALWTGLACMPLGLVWYARNLLLGHEAVTLPKAVWLTRALRNGDYLAPLLVALLISCLALILRHKLKGRDLAIVAIGAALLGASALASKAALFPARVDPPASYLRVEEALGIALGTALIAFGLRSIIKRPLSPRNKALLTTVIWALLLALPYFMTFFFSYSYHYRLGFAILPLLCLPSAVGLSSILDYESIQGWAKGSRRGYQAVLLLVCLPGVVAVATNVNWTTLWLTRGKLRDDFKKYEVFNPSLMQAVQGLEDFLRDSERVPVVLAPGEERLPFFFPQMTIHTEPLTTLDDIEALGATHFIYGAKAREAYLDAGIDPLDTQLVAALGRHDLFEKARSHYQGVFSYELYEVAETKRRHKLRDGYSALAAELEQVIYGERLQLFTGGVYPLEIHVSMPITFEPSWRALQPLRRDYEFVLHLIEPDGKFGYEWRFYAAAHRHGAFHTSHWQTDEYVNDRQILGQDDSTDFDGDGFTFWLGVWDRDAQAFLPLKLDGEAAGEFYRLPGSYYLWS